MPHTKTVPRYGAGTCPRTVCKRRIALRMRELTPGGGALNGAAGVSPKNAFPTIRVLVAVQSAQVREALVAMFGAREGFEVVAEAATDEQGLDLARDVRPHLAVIEQEISDCCGWWLIQSVRRERLAQVVVALGLRGDDSAARQAGADAYIQVGTSPREVMQAVQRALAAGGLLQAEHDLLARAHAVLDKPALVDL